MVSRKIKPGAAENIAAIALYIETKGMLATAERFSDRVYDYILTLADKRKSHHKCQDPARAALGYKCVTYKKKYTIVFLESDVK